MATALAAGARQTWLDADAVFGRPARRSSRARSRCKQLGGPIAITRASVAAAQSGLDELFYLIALLSINVAVLNLLPIPILDGGQILINVPESAKGSPFSMRTREYILRVGLVRDRAAVRDVMYNDTSRAVREVVRVGRG